MWGFEGEEERGDDGEGGVGEEKGLGVSVSLEW